jgi:hypothetical protein
MEPFCSIDRETTLLTIKRRQYQQYLTHTLKSFFFWDVMLCDYVTLSDDMVVLFQEHDETIVWSQNVRNQLPSDTASHIRRMGTSLHQCESSKTYITPAKKSHSFDLVSNM